MRLPYARSGIAGNRLEAELAQTLPVLWPRLSLTASGFYFHAFFPRSTVLTYEVNTDDCGFGADIASVHQVANLAAEEVEAEMADRSVGDDGNGGPQAAPAVCLGYGAGHKVDLAVEDEGQARKDAGAGDRVDTAGQRLVEQRGRRRCIADGSATLALVLG